MEIGNRAYKVLEAISFERLGGTDEEFKALNIIKKEIDAIGIKTEIEEFEIDSFKIKKAEFVVTKPINKKYNVTGYGMSGNVSDLSGPIYYLESTKMIPYLDLEGKIIILSQPIGYQLYEDLVKAKVSAIISSSGSVYDDFDNTDLEERNLRKRHFEHGKIPCFTIRMKDLEELILSNPEEACVSLEQEESKSISHNLVATIPGTKKINEIICFSAHYDSVRFSTGAYDNGTGSVTILEALRYFNEHKPDRTLKFIWCGSEEKGLLGAHAYVNKHKEELENYKLNINVDMTGIVLGRDIAVCTSEMSLPNYIDYFAKTIGFTIETSQGVYSSDSTPFAYNNVPAISFARISSRGGAEIHSRKDVIDYISPEYLEKTIVFINKFAENVINSVYFPVPKTMPQNMKDELDKYLGNKK